MKNSSTYILAFITCAATTHIACMDAANSKNIYEQANAILHTIAPGPLSSLQAKEAEKLKVSPLLETLKDVSTYFSPENTRLGEEQKEQVQAFVAALKERENAAMLSTFCMSICRSEQTAGIMFALLTSFLAAGIACYCAGAFDVSKVFCGIAFVLLGFLQIHQPPRMTSSPLLTDSIDRANAIRKSLEDLITELEKHCEAQEEE
jgi:hypothetical protein